MFVTWKILHKRQKLSECFTLRDFENLKNKLTIRFEVLKCGERYFIQENPVFRFEHLK